LRFAYHFTEDAFIEPGVAGSNVGDERYQRFGLPISMRKMNSCCATKFRLRTVFCPLEILPRENFARRVEIRDHLFESDLLGKDELTHNLKLVGGLSYLF